MKNLKIIVTGDWHADDDPIKAKKLSDSLGQMVQYCENNPVDYLLIAGDLWERPVREPFYRTSREGAAVRLVEKYLTKLSSLVKYVVICKGNNAHDSEQSIAMLNKRYANNILGFEYPAILAFLPDGNYIDLFRQQDQTEKILKGEVPYPEVIMPVFPYPDKRMLMEHATDIEASNDQYVQIFERLINAFGIICSKFTCPKVLGFHGEVVGSRLSNGQTLEKGLIISPNSLMLANCDFYNLAHIHLHQWLIPGIMGYGGSIYAKDFGETEQKYFNVLHFSEAGLTVEEVPITSARPMQNFKIGWNEGNFVYEKPDINYEAKIKFEIPESDLAMLTDDKIEQLKKDFGEDVKIEKTIIRAERAGRGDKIMDATTEPEEVEEWVNVAFAEQKESSGLAVNESGRIKISKTMIEKIETAKIALIKEESEEVTE